MLEAWQQFHFLRPWWLLGALPALALAYLWAQGRWRGSPWRDALDPELLAVLLEGGREAGRRWTPWLLALALLLGTVGLAGPAWTRLPQPVEQKSDGLVILFDLSLSMYAQDLSPSRLVRASHKIRDVLRRRQEGFTALVAYAGDSHIVAPLTDDTNTIENLLTALSPAMMPVLGSNPGSALELAFGLFANAGLEQGRLLMVTDAIDSVSELADRCRRSHPLSILGVGTESQASIPLDAAGQPGRHLTNQRGELVRVPLDADRLATVAQLCHGRYRSIEVGDGDLDQLLQTPLPKDDESIETDREFDAWADAGYWAALALLPLLLAGFRRGLLACLPLCLTAGLLAGLAPSPTHAGLWEDLWSRPDQQGHAALEQGRPDEAATLFEDPDWRSTAKYRGQDYEGAAADWQQRAQEPTQLYNLGNALAQLGDYEGAIAAYDKTLAAAPEHEDAAFNKALVEQLLQQQQEQQAQQRRGEENSGEQGDDAAGQAPQPGDQGQDGGAQAEEQRRQQEAEAAAEDQPEDGQEAGDLAQSAAEQDEDSRDEQAQALEQWLRRVPDDPGGLLRRKFQYETNQRLRNGDYRNRQQEKIW